MKTKASIQTRYHLRICWMNCYGRMGQGLPVLVEYRSADGRRTILRYQRSEGCKEENKKTEKPFQLYLQQCCKYRKEMEIAVLVDYIL